MRQVGLFLVLLFLVTNLFAEANERRGDEWLAKYCVNVGNWEHTKGQAGHQDYLGIWHSECIHN